MKKLLYITDGIYPATIGGMQKVSLQHIQMLSDSIEVCVIYSGEEITNMLENVTYIHIPWPKEIGFYINKYPHQLRLFSTLVKKQVNNIKPDIIYTEGPLVDSLLSKSLSNIPIIFHPHGLEPFQDKGSLLDNLKANILKPIIKRHCLFSDKVVTQGGKLSEILLNTIGVPKEHLYVLQNVFSVDHDEKDHWDIENKKFDLIFVGRNEKRKGLDFALNALSQMGSSISVCVVGSHDEYQKKYRKMKNIFWAGEITEPKKIQTLYKKSRFLILPSFAEGMPTVLLEAMSQGTPAIASDVGAVKEVIEEDVNGYLFEKGQKNSFVNQVKRAFRLSNRDYKELSVQSKKCIEKDFSFNVVQRKLVNLVTDM